MYEVNMDHSQQQNIKISSDFISLALVISREGFFCIQVLCTLIVGTWTFDFWNTRRHNDQSGVDFAFAECVYMQNTYVLDVTFHLSR